MNLSLTVDKAYINAVKETIAQNMWLVSRKAHDNPKTKLNHEAC